MRERERENPTDHELVGPVGHHLLQLPVDESAIAAVHVGQVEDRIQRDGHVGDGRGKLKNVRSSTHYELKFQMLSGREREREKEREREEIYHSPYLPRGSVAERRRRRRACARHVKELRRQSQDCLLKYREC